MVVKTKTMTRGIWLVGDKRKGIKLVDMARKKGRHSWYLQYWRNGRLTRQPEDFPTKAEAIQHAKGRVRIGWYD